MVELTAAPMACFQSVSMVAALGWNLAAQVDEQWAGKMAVKTANFSDAHSAVLRADAKESEMVARLAVQLVALKAV